MNKESKDYFYEYENSSDEFIAGGKTFRKETFENGSSYVGEFREDEWHGQGTLTFPDGSKYDGEFKNGKYHGQGTFIYLRGWKYTGEFREDEWHGQGTLTFPDGGRYTGGWRDGKRHGQGTLTFPDGGRYTGEWRDGEMYGFGVGVRSIQVKRTTEAGDYLPTKETYVGKFLNGLPHGDGIYHYSNGDKYIGTWQHGEIVAGQGYIFSKETQKLASDLKKLKRLTKRCQ